MLSILDIHFPSEFRCYVQYDDGSIFYGKNLNELIADVENNFIWHRHHHADIIFEDTGEVIMNITPNYAAIATIAKHWS